MDGEKQNYSTCQLHLTQCLTVLQHAKDQSAYGALMINDLRDEIEGLQAQLNATPATPVDPAQNQELDTRKRRRMEYPTSQ